MFSQIKKLFNENKNLSRIIIGSTVFFASLFSLYFGGIFLTIVMLCLWWQVNNEYIHIVRAKGYNPSNYWIKFVSLLFILTASMPYFGYDRDLPIKLYIFVFIFGVIGCFFRLVLRGSKKESIASIADISTSVLGFIYTGLLPSFLLLLQQLDFAYVLCACFGTTWCDIGAYYGGKIFGRHKLKPEISPKKTIEGSIFGFITSMIACFFVYFFSKPFFNYNPIHPLLIGIFCGVFSQFGDLFESLLKRDAGLKDSSEVLLSHGGVLDRVDGYLFVLWAVYFYVSWIILQRI